MAEDSATKSQKKKKINRLTLTEVEAQLQEINKTQGGWHSRYAQHLEARKKALSGQD
ncbi:MAG: hypothetical protein RBR88_05055 [Candidatus Saccharicenans sp.]|nr:hypothetical protein [Candidatus Saccharicenans sp.]